MQLYIGTVTGREIKQNRDGDHPVRLLQVEFATDDVQTVEQMSNEPGDDSSPPDGARVLVLQVSKAFKVVIAVDDEIDPEVEPGERKIYSSENGAIKAFAYFKKDGVIELNGANDFAARFNELKNGFDALVDDFNAHTHDYLPGPGSATPTDPPTSSTASIDAAKIDEIKVP
jgi:hypothetical protein